MASRHIGMAPQATSAAQSEGTLRHKVATTDDEAQAGVPDDAPCILVLVGAAHVPGLRMLLSQRI